MVMQRLVQPALEMRRDEGRRVLEKTRWFDADHSDALQMRGRAGKGLEESPGKASS